jgi:hypothetical protein
MAQSCNCAFNRFNALEVIMRPIHQFILLCLVGVFALLFACTQTANGPGVTTTTVSGTTTTVAGTTTTTTIAVSSITPADGSTDVHKWANIEIMLTGSSDGSTKGTVSFTTPAITFTDGANCVMQFSTTVSSNDTIVLSPRIELAATLAGTAYSGLSLSGFRDTLNNPVTHTDVAYSITVIGDLVYLPFNGDADDVSGNGFNGTVNGPALASDRDGTINSAYHFDGVDDYIDLGDPISGALDLTDNFTLSTWINADSLSYLAGFISKYQSPAANGFTFRLGPDKGFDFPVMVVIEGTDNSLSVGAWYHVAVTVSARDVFLYVNGVEQGTGTLGVGDCQPNSDPVNIGVDYQVGGGRYFDGLIDDVRIYNYPLSAEEINNLYQTEN